MLQPLSGMVSYGLMWEQPLDRPDRHGAHERRGIVEEAHGLLRQSGIARIADRDEHVADEAVAARCA